MTAGGVVVFAYGLLAYAAFFGTILYAIGFVGNWFVPKSIDSGAGAGYAEAILVNGGILVLFVAQHTVMARSWFKAWWTRIIPASIERSTFVFLASAILMALFWQWRPLPGVVWSVEHPAAVYGLNALSLAGWGVVFASSFMVSHFDLFGLRQSLFGLLGLRYRPVGFRLVGLYKVVRHPLMVGFLIAFWSAPTMTEGRLLFAALTTGYIFFGTWIEERSLIAEHGETYEAYRRRVRGFIPIPRSAPDERGAA
ncbi:MAG: isoprenylcysteine carboxylmethyltransferase family protein [Phycisphaeraceae bacterium]|nr:MAG: isoprenylcysteine carboxylmethyltransferase family protein [Phycisphaeraceae bacterium]